MIVCKNCGKELDYSQVSRHKKGKNSEEKANEAAFNISSQRSSHTKSIDIDDMDLWNIYVKGKKMVS